jgi:predicted SprT family Zn-dependent metalloprotease
LVANEIRICPRGATQEEIEHTIHHEITHLHHEHEVQGMTHKEKEEYIIGKE